MQSVFFFRVRTTGDRNLRSQTYLRRRVRICLDAALRWTHPHTRSLKRRMHRARWASFYADSPAEGLMHSLPDAVLTPAPKDRVHPLLLRKVLRQLPPLTAGPDNIQNRIENPAAANRSSTTSGSLRKQATNHSPLPIREIAGIHRAHHYGSVFLDLRTKKAESSRFSSLPAI
jgi:hypothetical protein